MLVIDADIPRTYRLYFLLKKMKKKMIFNSNKINE